LEKNDNNLEQNLNLTQTLDEEKFKLAISNRAKHWVDAWVDSRSQ
jgi:hypothetical protein